jgi:hypothetical protein
MEMLLSQESDHEQYVPFILTRQATLVGRSYGPL